MMLLPIASGKGGVGKSLVATNMALALAEQGASVVLADLDLGGSNDHLILGIGGIREGIGAFFNNPRLNFNDIIFATEYENLRFIPGDSEFPGMANINISQKKRLLQNLLKLDCDYLILDLGAGTSYNTIDFFLTTRQGIIVTNPTLTATLNAYMFLKNVVFRIIYTTIPGSGKVREYIDSLRLDGKSFQRIYIPKMLEKIERIDPSSFFKLRKKLSIFCPLLIINMVHNPADSKKAEKIQRSCQEYLGINFEHLGVIVFDHLQNVALNSRLPILRYKPNSIISQGVYRIANKIMDISLDGKNRTIDLEMIENSFRSADVEAQLDYDLKEREVNKLLRGAAYKREDLIETIRNQQFEIAALRRENEFLKREVLKNN